MTIQLTAYIEGIGILGPGLTNWPSTLEILTGEQPYLSLKTVIPTPELLPAAERRRASDIVKLTLATSLEAIAAAGLEAASLPSVFSFSNGDGLNCHTICEMLASDDRQISPTRFHNSVHNAAAGYWSIATGAMASSSVLCAFDASFGAGLLDAMTQVVVEGSRCILMASDTPYPEPMFSLRSIPDNLGIALVLAPQQNPQTIAQIKVSITHDDACKFQDAALESLRIAIPVARGLPLLQAIAQQKNRRVVLDYLDNTRLAIEVSPC
ncbi:beta-ketoacyl synthase chain length factor [Methylotenera sp.]|uniref:beta-ketoacyl synthase chain length factor n=1 Tax=Methylotenera sp. TaxID=2051956 RepID=UPI002730A9FA|nr:beta-ketoacyl synthase chain length factor [Methylotenera sp.]MDP2071623.1 beta-ketoacyl synthase chain length factor [Methylotenera sp.]MDP3006713.1 beta-ketoacyl synthase chain length factor [Methylotenera sp.]